MVPREQAALRYLRETRQAYQLGREQIMPSEEFVGSLGTVYVVDCSIDHMPMDSFEDWRDAICFRISIYGAWPT